MQSLGLIETKGYALGIEAVDAAMKSANVELLGHESTNGEGRTIFKIIGDVGAVKAAVDAAKSVVMRKNGVVYTKVIARPSAALEKLIYTSDNKEIDNSKSEKVLGAGDKTSAKRAAKPKQETVEETTEPQNPENPENPDRKDIDPEKKDEKTVKENTTSNTSKGSKEKRSEGQKKSK